MADAAEAALRLEQESRLLAEAEAARHKEIAEFHKRKAASRLHRRAMSRLAHSGKRQVTRSLECVNRITLVAVNSTLQSLVDGLKNIDVTGDTSLADQYTKEDPDIFPFFVDSNRRNDYVNEIDLVNLKNLYGFLTKRSMDLQFSDDDKEVMAADILEDTAATLEKISNDHSVYALSVGDAVSRLKVVSTPTDTVKVDKEDVEISDLVADACSTLGKVYQDQSFRMKIEGEYTLSLSRDSILEALYNVAENCIESNRSSGNKTIDVGVEGDKKGIYIKFGDYGIGLNDEQLKLLNSGIPLKTTKGEFGGGVGASDAYSVIVDLHGGNIIYKNRDEPKGVDTYIFLPYEQKEVILDW